MRQHFLTMQFGVLLASAAVIGSVQSTPVFGQEMAQHARAAAKPSTSVQVTTPDGQITLSTEQLRAMPQTTVTVHNAHTNREEHYSGVKLTDVLARAGAKSGKATLHSYVTAEGTDGYWVLYSGEEISDLVHAGSVIVAVAEEDQLLHDDGELKLVSTEDKKPERWVRNLRAIRWHEASE